MSHRVTRRGRSFIAEGVGLLEGRQLLSHLVRPVSIPALPMHVPADVGTAIAPEVHVARHRHVHHVGHPAGMHAATTARRWSWLGGTYWYVPASNLSATLFDSGTGALLPVHDQTVFQITGYRAGYFWGKTAAQFDSSTPSASSMVGSITPQGRVLLTFTSTGSTSGPLVTEGYGQMVRHRGRWSMENQMFTSPSQSLQIGHWAYMMPTHPGSPSWNSLPLAGVSVPTFLAEAGGSAPQPIGP